MRLRFERRIDDKWLNIAYQNHALFICTIIFSFHNIAARQRATYPAP